MLNFTEIDNDEVREYLKQNELLDEINNIENRMKKEIELINKIKLNILINDFKDSIVLTDNLICYNIGLDEKIRNLLRKIPVEEEIKENIIISDVKVFSKIEKEKDYLHLVMNNLLPARIKNNKNRAYLLRKLNQEYHKELFPYFKKGKLLIYESKVVIVIINHFSDENSIKDHDNFEIKPIIDTISSFVLPDDNPDYCAHYMDSKYSETAYSEIFVIPETSFAQFIKKGSYLL